MNGKYRGADELHAQNVIPARFPWQRVPGLLMSPQVRAQDQPDSKVGKAPRPPTACLAVSDPMAGGVEGVLLNFSMHEHVRGDVL